MELSVPLPRFSPFRRAPAFSFLCAAIYCAMTAPAWATDVCGPVCDEVWILAASPYVVSCDSDVTLAAGCALMIEPGVEVRFNTDTALLIQGTLTVTGTATDVVLFTSSAASPQKGDWGGLTFESSGTGEIDHATIAYATNGIYTLGGSIVTVADSTLRDSTRGAYVSGTSRLTMTDVISTANDYGLYVTHGTATAHATGGAFTANAQYGVYVHGNGTYTPEVTIDGAEIHSNLGSYDLYVIYFRDPAQHVVLARNCWWNSTDPSVIGNRVYDRRRTTIAPAADWCGYLDSPGGLPHLDRHCPDLVVCDGASAWDLVDRPYQLTSDVSVCPTGTLVLGSGVEVRAVGLAQPLDVVVEGTLDVNGTAGEPVEFRSDATVPSEGDWGGVTFQGDGVGEIDHANIAYATNGIYTTGDSVVTVADSTLRDSTRGAYVSGTSRLTMTGTSANANDYGLYVSGGNSTTHVSGGGLKGNALYGVYVHGNGVHVPEVTITGAAIHSNLGSYDLYAISFPPASTHVVWAPDCWWNTTNVDAIRGRIYDHEDSAVSPRVSVRPFGEECDVALGLDRDGDRIGDFEDNCPIDHNPGQVDTDGDSMGDSCDPEPGAKPAGACDGMNDVFDGFADADNDTWGDPCDFQPTRDDCYPGAPEICDGRDNDGDALFAIDELFDGDLDRALTCGDCDDLDPLRHACACEECASLIDEDCDDLIDEDDPDCAGNPYCILVNSGSTEPCLDLQKGTCVSPIVSGPFELIRGFISQLQFFGESVDLGEVHCVDGYLRADRVTDYPADPNPVCNDPLMYYLARDSGSADFGSASGGEARDEMNPDPACP